MIGAVIGGALAAGGSLINGLLGANEARKQERELARQERENQAWYDRRFNEVGHERADAQRLLTKMHDEQQARAKAAAGRQAVVGASSSAQATEKQAANQATGDAVGRIDAAQEARKDKIEASYRARQQQLADARNKVSAARQANLAQAATGAAVAGAGIAQAYSDTPKAKPAASTPTGATATTTGTIEPSVWSDINAQSPTDWYKNKTARKPLTLL